MRAWSRGLVVVVVLALAGCTGGGGDAERADDAGELDVRVGVLAPLTGGGSVAGQEILRGAQFAAELINEGTLKSLSGTDLPAGIRVSVVGGDTKNDDPDTAVENAVRLVDDERVAALIGAGSPAVMAATSERTERLGVPFIGAEATADFLTQRGLAWFFRTGPTERSLAATLFSVLRQQAAEAPGAARMAIVYPAHSDPTQIDAADLVALLSELAGEGGFDLPREGKVRVDLRGDPTAALDEAAAKVQSVHPGAVFLVAPSVGEARTLLQRFRGLPGQQAVIGFGAGFTDPAFVSTAGKDAAGLLYSATWSYALAARSPAIKPILDAYAERNDGRRMSEAAASGFTAVQGLAEAVGRVRSSDRGQLRTALLGLELSGRSTIMPWEGIRFDASGQNVQAVGIVEQRVGDAGKIVFPLGIADAAVVPLSKATG